MFEFKNIDRFIPGRFERMGMLKGKRWYTGFEPKDEEPGNEAYLVLFKPKRKEYGDRKIFCANHYGEFIGYLLAIGSRTPACKVELASLSKYYENIYKERNCATPEQKNGCISYCNLENGEVLHHGQLVIDEYVRNHPSIESVKNYENDINVCISAIEEATREYYDKSSFKRSQEYIEGKVVENRKTAVNMIIYDCLYGNNDRHDENWAMVKDLHGRDISLYSLYDNERVLGLYENIKTIQSALNSNTVETFSEKAAFSRMTVPDEVSATSSYKDVLTYLISTYPETQELLERHLKGNTPMKVKMYLESCEDLPECYVDYGSKMYQSRYDFAKELARKVKEGNKTIEDKNSTDLENR